MTNGLTRPGPLPPFLLVMAPYLVYPAEAGGQGPFYDGVYTARAYGEGGFLSPWMAV